MFSSHLMALFPLFDSYIVHKQFRWSSILSVYLIFCFLSLLQLREVIILDNSLYCVSTATYKILSLEGVEDEGNVKKV